MIIALIFSAIQTELDPLQFAHIAGRGGEEVTGSL